MVNIPPIYGSGDGAFMALSHTHINELIDG